MKPSRKVATVALLAFACVSCRVLGVEWSNHVSFRASGAEMHLAQIDPREIVSGRISRNVHYVSVALDTVFFKDLPGLRGKADVVLGFEIQGVLADGRVLKSVPEIRQAAGAEAFLSFDNVALLEPFRYTGQNITITLHFRAVAPDEATAIQGRIAGAGDLLKKIDPLVNTALETASSLFASVIGAIAKKEMTWKYSFTLLPSDGVIRDKPDILFTAARHILLLMPSADAPDRYRQVRPQHLVQGLKLRGNRLVWKDTEEEYTLAPYIILNITRYKRYPRADTELRKLVTQLKSSYENNNLEMAKSTLPAIGAAIVNDKVITATEKRLERSLKDYWESRIDAKAAARRKDKQSELESNRRQIRTLLGIKEHFRDILEPSEVKDIGYDLAKLKDATQDLAKELGEAFPEDLLAGIKDEERREREREDKRREEGERILKRFAAAAVSPAAPAVALTTPLALPPRREGAAGIWQKWWFWTIVGAVVVGGASGAYVLTRSSEPGGLVIGK
jgi:hypothetical protein